MRKMENLMFGSSSKEDEFKTQIDANLVLDMFIPVVTMSEMNVFGHWSVRYKRFKEQKARILAKWQEEKIKISTPCHVLMIRVSPRAMDDDNLRGALKACRDIIADIIIPNKSAGHADSSPLIVWEYHQERRQPKTYGLHVKIYEMPK